MSFWLSVVMQEMGIPEKLSKSCKYSEDKGLFILPFGQCWMNLFDQKLPLLLLSWDCEV